ncbi:uncharacterized protein MEPE_02473 [Melanopsichium pennsylvanicum]|uniref:Chromosome transmission fidelity protein 8 n=2 Tax=Melanopsichium pennsylvanicum TaxID=63383 RepID=A0AAJ4XJR4_9BASI|nr:hypothetical protein BN887_00430 [Melanopsichium pennsylvanicum 4]SNX83765.1 uncharacterized protein MEPE_02473 [Melanopsichium pennsylvanicum]
MRIHLNLPNPATSIASTSSTTLSSTAPTPLTALTPNGELILIELQGSLEIENQSPSGGQVLGTITFDPTRPDRPVLMISHHRLEGKFVNLVRPLAVLEKKVRSDADKLTEKAILLDIPNGKMRMAATMVGEQATVRHKVGHVRKARVSNQNEENGRGIRSSSPPDLLSSPKRKSRDALDFSSSPVRETPVRPRGAVAKASAQLNDIHENGVNQIASLANQITEKEAQEGEDEQEEVEEPQTAVYYDVVNVIKRKILFSKRPEPIVRLDTSTRSTDTL